MGEKERCGHECTCKNPLSHYLVIMGGFLRIGSLVFGIAFSSEAAEDSPSLHGARMHIENLITIIDEFTEKLVGD